MIALGAVCLVLGFPCLLAALVWYDSGETWVGDMMLFGLGFWGAAALLFTVNALYHNLW